MASIRRGSAVAVLEPEDAADAAGLRYVRDDRPGIRRLGTGQRFHYVRPGGARVRDAATLARIRGLAIPPAYRDVWICPDPLGHLQATGRDARGRKQYRYHARWREQRDETKFDRMLAFSRALPAIRRRAALDLARPGLPREKVLAAVVRLLEDTCVRVGNEEYVRANDSYGLTTLRDEHVEVAGERVRFEFRGKRGKIHRCQLEDRRLARVVARCQALPGEELFQYHGDDGEPRAIGSGDVNDYLRAVAGESFTAKDFRTWSGTLLAARALLAAPPARSAAERKRSAQAALDAVAARLHNTRTVCRKYYVHPGLLEAYEAGRLDVRAGRARRIRGLSSEESSLVAFLERTARR
jgi:DNA topoisomerase-1